MTFNSRLSVGEGLDHLAARLDPIIASRLAGVLGGLPWTEVLVQLDFVAGRPPRQYSRTDLQTQLKMFTIRLGNLGYPFDSTRLANTLGQELKIVRNAWTHGDPFTRLDAWRAHDHCVRLLEFFADAEGLVHANELRQDALAAYVEEEGIAPIPVQPAATLLNAALAEPLVAAQVEPEREPEVVTPDPMVFTREPSTTSSLVGDTRLVFEPWLPVPVGDVDVLDDLPKAAAKQKVRAVAIEIVEAEGPIHVSRLALLVAASFDVHRLHARREDKIIRQIKATNLVVDKDRFVWPDGVDPAQWREFRPSSSEVARPFLQISPVEIANAMRFLRGKNPAISTVDLEAETLQTFGRRRRTRQFAAHLAKARALLDA